MRMPPDPSPDRVVAVSMQIAPPRELITGSVSCQLAMKSGATPKGMASASFVGRGGRDRRRTAVRALGRPAGRAVARPEEPPLYEMRRFGAAVVSTGRRRRHFWRGFLGRWLRCSALRRRTPRAGWVLGAQRAVRASR